MKKALSVIFLFSLITLIAIPLTSPVLAQEEIPSGCTIGTDFEFDTDSYTAGTVIDESTENWGMICVMNAIYTATNWIFVIIMVLAVIVILFGAFTLLTAAGDPDKVGRGRNYVVYAIVGFAVALLAKALPSLVKFVLGM